MVVAWHAMVGTTLLAAARARAYRRVVCCPTNPTYFFFFFFSTKRFAVAAESFDDIVAGVAFAAKHNLRVAVKGTGHDWFGQLKRNTLRSAA